MISNSSLIYSQIYVSNAGNDSYNGSKDRPFKSIKKAMTTASNYLSGNQKEIKIILASGEYILDAPIEINPALWRGTNNLVVEGAKESMPVIKGSVSAGKFTKRAGNFWTLDLSAFLRNNKVAVQQIFVNGKRATLARTPNIDNLYTTLKTEEVKDKPNKKSNHTVYLTPEQWNTFSAAKNKKYILAAFNHQWNRTRVRIKNSSNTTKSIQLETSLFADWTKLGMASQFYFENDKSFLDAPGEWFIDDKNILYYVPRAGEVFSSTTVEIPLLGELLKIEGTAGNKVRNIAFKNISFQHTNRIMPAHGDMPAQAASPTSAAITLNFAENINFDNCEIGNVSNNAIWIRKGCNNVKVINSYIHDLGVGGIKIGDIVPPANSKFETSNTIVENNIITRGGFELPTGIGVTVFHSGSNSISHNEISYFYYSGVSVGWVWGYRNSVAKNNKIIYNHIHHLGFSQLSDLGGIYTLGPSPGTEISNNVIHDVFSNDFRGWGIYLDEGSSDILIENNLVYNCKSAGFHQHYGKNNIVRNNIFANQVNSQLEVSRKEEHNSFTFTNNIVYFTTGKLSDRTGWDIANFIADKNIYWNPRQQDVKFYNSSITQWKNKNKKDIHSYVMDPLFRNPEAKDFTFKSTTNISKINFKPFDYRKAGVTDSNNWKKADL